jgi:hypothetical protein
VLGLLKQKAIHSREIGKIICGRDTGHSGGGELGWIKLRKKWTMDNGQRTMDNGGNRYRKILQ